MSEIERAERAARVTAAKAELGDFRRAADFYLKTGKAVDWQAWAHRLSHFVDVLIPCIDAEPERKSPQSQCETCLHLLEVHRGGCMVIGCGCNVMGPGAIGTVQLETEPDPMATPMDLCHRCDHTRADHWARGIGSGCDAETGPGSETGCRCGGFQ